jgi:hypothetical protein
VPFSRGGCHFRVKIPKASTVFTGQLLRKIVLIQNGHQLALGETVRLYDCLRPMSPSTKELSDDPFQRPKTALGAFDMYYRFGNSSLIPVRLTTSENGFSVADLREGDAMNGTRLSDLAERAGIDVAQTRRVLKIKNFQIIAIVGLENVIERECEYRFEFLGNASRCCLVNYGVRYRDTKHIAAFGQPFVLEIAEGENIKEKLVRMVTGLNRDEEYQIVVTKAGTTIVSRNLDDLTLTVMVTNKYATAYFDVDGFFSSQIRFLN